MAEAVPPWRLVDFLVRLDEWAKRENASDDLRLLVTAWIMSRYEDPYEGMRLEPGWGNLWFGPVPNSEDGAGQIVTCSVFIEESTRTVRCNSIATLSLPI